MNAAALRTAIVVFGWTMASAAAEQARVPACPPGRLPMPAECGTIRVFENRQTKQGRKIDIAFARLRAERSPSSGAVFLLNGGPGGEGMDMAGVADGWARPLRTTMDVVLVDQRGTGRSNSLECARDLAAHPAQSFGHVFPEAWIRECRASLDAKADLRHYTTDDAVEDLEEVRAALGYERINLYGGSYGTRLAQAYLRRYPARTRSVVLDGAVPFDINIPLTYAATAQQALARVLQTRPGLSGDFSKLLARFDKGSVATSVTLPSGTRAPVQMTRGDFGYAVRGILYNANGVRSLPDMIAHAAATGDVAEFAQQYLEREMRFNRGFSIGLHFSVLCAEDVRFIQPQDLAAATAQTFLGRYLVDEYQRACALWPVADLRADFRRPISASTPTLLISGAFDPVTPPEFAERIAKTLSASRLVVAKQGAHGSAGWCAGAALFVLQKGTVAGAPVTCR